jgi:hypothetical protein
MIENLKYIIFDMSEIDKIDFTKVKEDSVDTLTVSVDGTKSFINWEGEEPSFVATLETKSQYYTNDEMITIINTPEWIKVPFSGTTN